MATVAGQDADWRPQGDESDPVAAGIAPEGLRAALDEAEGRGGRWQLVVWKDDQLLVDRASDTDGPDLFWAWSASKPVIALLVWQLIEAGAIGVDDPVARWWPEFAVNGKQDVTVRHLLQHRSGLPTGPGGQFADVAAMTDWRWSTHRLARGTPKWAPGERSAYHYLSYGFALGEVVRRVTGRELPELMRAQIFEPLALSNSYLGLPGTELARAVPLRVAAPGGRAVELLLNSARVRQAVIPAGGISTTAHDLARFYRAMLAGGELDGARVASAETIDQMRRQSSIDGEPDGLLHYPVRFGQGFQLGGPAVGWPAVEPFGHLSSRQAFGHNGSNVCVAWADPEFGLVVTYLGSRVRGWQTDRTMLRRLADSLLAACRPATNDAVRWT
ncbi:MAG: serine hydrolase domain-containing protein [Acidobacteriota bacterium]|nr:serine hydrolase domain-containing protein [Acidobacteriota bacterium]NLH70209.1 beta-lactamase family protein [Brooklawnia sp.]